jgi:hypothetical protein
MTVSMFRKYYLLVEDGALARLVQVSGKLRLMGLMSPHWVRTLVLYEGFAEPSGVVAVGSADGGGGEDENQRRRTRRGSCY